MLRMLVMLVSPPKRGLATTMCLSIAHCLVDLNMAPRNGGHDQSLIIVGIFGYE